MCIIAVCIAKTIFEGCRVSNQLAHMTSMMLRSSRATPIAPKTPECRTFNIVLVGSGGVGKTAFIKKLQTSKFCQQYKPTFGMNIVRLNFDTTYGPIVLDCWDTAGQEKFGMHDRYYIGAHGAIVMFDVESKSSYLDVGTWHKSVSRVCGSIPTVMCGNKVDVKQRTVRPEDITYHVGKDMPYVDLSVRSDYNINKPFLSLCRMLTGKKNLDFIAK